MEASAKYSFNATADDELSFTRGEVLKILKWDGDNQWFKAQLNGKEGFIPGNYIDFTKPEFFSQQGNRRAAEETLMGKGEEGEYLQPDGAFLIRPSETTPGDFSLSVKWENAVQHFKVLRDGNGKFFLWTVKFNSLNELVNYHRTNSLSNGQTILLKDMTQEVKHRPERHLYVKGQYDFDAEEDAELSFRKNDELKILEKSDELWWKAELNGSSGLIPANYVTPIYKR